MEKVVYQDLYQFNFISDPLIAPDGKHAIFARHNAVEETNGYRSEVWVIDLKTGEYHPLTTGGDERGAFWIDADTVAFVTSRGKKKDAKEQKESTEWYQINIHGGEAVPFMSVNERASQIKLIDENTYVYTTEHTAPENNPLPEPENEGEAADRAEQGKDFDVFDEIPFWFNGRKVINKKRGAIMLCKQGEVKAITPPYLDATGMQLSPDKTKLVYGGCEYKDKQSWTSGMYLYDLTTGETQTLVAPGAVAVGGFYFMGSDDIFFTRTREEKRGDNPDFCLYHLKTGEVETLPFPDLLPYNSVGTDAAYGGGQGMKYENGYLYFLRTAWGNSHLVRVNHEGALETVVQAPGSVSAFDIAQGVVIFTAMRGSSLAELYRCRADEPEAGEERLTHLNEAYEQSHSVITPEYFMFENREGVTLEGFVLKPLGFEAGKKYPGILEMHGGPKVAFGSVFHHEMQCFANMGYFVFYTNPRGSDGRGEAFARLNGRMGTIDYEDFMDFTDEVIRRYPELDSERIGVCGGSYGGFMCNWIIGHTNRFAAAASQRSIANYFTKMLCTDIGVNHNSLQVGDPWENTEQVWRASPLQYAPQAQTPTLFIQSDEDYRCWMSDAIQMFNALQQNGVPTRLALFHGETHELSRSGRPKNRISRLTEIGDWFEQYLKA